MALGDLINTAVGLAGVGGISAAAVNYFKIRADRKQGASGLEQEAKRDADSNWEALTATMNSTIDRQDRKLVQMDEKIDKMRAEHRAEMDRTNRQHNQELDAERRFSDELVDHINSGKGPPAPDRRLFIVEQ